MATENLIATLEQSLRQTRSARTRLAARLAELEAEAETLRAELAEMDTLTSQTEAAVVRLLSSVLTPQQQQQQHAPTAHAPSDSEIEAAMQRDKASRSGFTPHTVIPRHHIPPVRPEVEVKSDRFFDRTIPQATTMILREAGEPLHVNEIYNRLLEGGFQFTGQNPTISIAVSLNRNGRFRKVAPGTFDLVMRDASQAS